METVARRRKSYIVQLMNMENSLSQRHKPQRARISKVSPMYVLSHFSHSAWSSLTHSLSTKIYKLPLSQLAGIVWTGARVRRHYEWGMTQPWMAHSYTVHSQGHHTARLCSHSWVLAISLVSDSILFPSHGFCFAAFLLITPALYNLSLETLFGFFLSLLYIGAESWRLSF